MSVTACPPTRPVSHQQLITSPRILPEEHTTKCLWVYLLSKVEMLRLRALASPPTGRFGRVGVVAAGRVHRPEAASG